MAIAEMEFDPSKRDFLTLGFARRGRGGSPPRRTDGRSTPTQPERPSGWDKIITRRNLLRVASGIAGAGIGLFIADRLGLLDQSEPSKREMGIKLENLQFNTEEGKRMEKDRVYQLGKISLEQSTTNYELTIDGKQFTDMANKCGVNNIPEVFQIIIAERYASLNNQGKMEDREAEVTSDGSRITFFIGLDTLFKVQQKHLDEDFEVSTEKRAQAEANFNILVLNRTIMRILCAATILSDLDRRGTSRQEAEQATDIATLTADNFRDEILNGIRQPAIIVSRSSRNII